MNCRTCGSDSYQGDRCGLCGRTACVDCATFSNADLLDFKHLEKYRNEKCQKGHEKGLGRPTLAPKLYAVLRDCCRSGQCLRCWPEPRDPSRCESERRIAVCQGHDLTLPKAKEVARNWGELRGRYVPNPLGLSCKEVEDRANAKPERSCGHKLATPFCEVCVAAVKGDSRKN